LENKQNKRKISLEEEEDNGKEALQNIDSWDWWIGKINLF
jgi:hypothetical protein